MKEFAMKRIALLESERKELEIHFSFADESERIGISYMLKHYDNEIEFMWRDLNEK